MVKMTLKINGKEKKILAPEQRPLQEILKENAEGYSSLDLFILNGRKLSQEDLNQSILGLGFDGKTDLILEAMDDVPWYTDEETDQLGNGSVICPPKVQIIGCACIVHSSMTLDVLQDFRCCLPEALTRRDESGEPVFAIFLDENSPGSLDQNGAVFSRHTNRDGTATITILLDPECEDRENLVRKQLGAAILGLIEMEEYLVTRVPEMRERKSLLESHVSKA